MDAPVASTVSTSPRTTADSAAEGRLMVDATGTKGRKQVLKKKIKPFLTKK